MTIPLPPKSVLVVEDDASIKDTISMFLDWEGYPVVSAMDGQEALKKLVTMSPPPGLILLDLMMPVMNGWEFLDQLRNKYPNSLAKLHIVILSAVNGAEKAAAELSVALLKKPINLDNLLNIVRQNCGEAQPSRP